MPVTGRIVGKVLMAAAVGAALTGVGLWWGHSSPEAIGTTATTTTALSAAAPFLDPHEVIFGATALIPESVEISGERVTFSYDVDSLGPGGNLLSGDWSDPATLVWEYPAMPETFRLTLADGSTVDGRALTTQNRSVDFRLSREITAADIRGIALTGWRLASTAQYDLTFASDDRSPLALDDGGTLAIDATTTNQDGDTIVVLHRDAPDDLFTGSPSGDLVLSGVGEGWETSFFDSTGAHLVHHGPLPDEFKVHVFDTVWHPRSVYLPIDLPEVTS